MYFHNRNVMYNVDIWVFYANCCDFMLPISNIELLFNMNMAYKKSIRRQCAFTRFEEWYTAWFKKRNFV